MGEGLKRAMAHALASGTPHPTVEDSCGCVFCDLELKPIKSSTGHWRHGTPAGWVDCTNPKRIAKP